MREVDGHLWAGDVVDLHRQQGDASALIAEREVDALFCHRDGFDFGVDVHFVVDVEATFARGDAADQFVGFCFPWGWFTGGGVEFVVEEAEGLLAGERVAWEEAAVTDGELDLDVDAVGFAALDEGHPEPVVDVVVGHVADDVRTPVDAFLEVCEGFFHPLERKKVEISILGLMVLRLL